MSIIKKLNYFCYIMHAQGSYKVLELLTERGGDIHLKDKDGQTPIHLTTRNRNARCLESQPLEAGPVNSS